MGVECRRVCGVVWCLMSRVVSCGSSTGCQFSVEAQRSRVVKTVLEHETK